MDSLHFNVPLNTETWRSFTSAALISHFSLSFFFQQKRLLIFSAFLYKTDLRNILETLEATVSMCQATYLANLADVCDKSIYSSIL